MIFTLLTGCVSERHFAADTLWPFGDPNAPDNNGETAERALGKAPDVTPIPPQEGNVWPGAVQPVPTIADIEKNMNEPLGKIYTPSLPSPYPPGQEPPPDKDGDDSDVYTIPPNGVPPSQSTPAITPGVITPDTNSQIGAPAAVTPGTNPPGTVVPGTAAPIIVPGNPHARE